MKLQPHSRAALTWPTPSAYPLVLVSLILAIMLLPHLTNVIQYLIVEVMNKWTILCALYKHGIGGSSCYSLCLFLGKGKVTRKFSVMPAYMATLSQGFGTQNLSLFYTIEVHVWHCCPLPKLPPLWICEPSLQHMAAPLPQLHIPYPNYWDSSWQRSCWAKNRCQKRANSLTEISQNLGPGAIAAHLKDISRKTQPTPWLMPVWNW